jgi:hypothetical protein
MTRYKFEELLKRYTVGNCTEKEKRRVTQWFKNLAFEIEEPKSQNEYTLLENKLLNKIEARINEGKLKNERPPGGFTDPCLICLGAIDSLLLLETFNTYLLFT